MTDSDKKEPAKGGGPPKDSGGPKGPHWTLEKIRLLTDAEVKALKANAERLAAHSVAEMCEVVLEERRPPPRAGAVKYGTINRTVKDKREEKDSAGLLEELAARLLERFDLSKETAKRLAAGSKSKGTHTLLGKHGTAKVGGGQKSGNMTFVRYISYRIGDGACYLNIVKFPDSEKILYEVFAPKRLLTDPVPIPELRPYLREGERIAVCDWGQHLETFDAAAEFYEHLLEQFAPLKKA